MEAWGWEYSNLLLCGNIQPQAYPGRPKETQEGSESPRKAQEGPERPKEPGKVQRGVGRSREA